MLIYNILIDDKNSVLDKLCSNYQISLSKYKSQSYDNAVENITLLVQYWLSMRSNEASMYFLHKSVREHLTLISCNHIVDHKHFLRYKKSYQSA